VRTDTAVFAKHNAALSKEPRYVIEMAFDLANTVLWYFTSHADAALPGGGGIVTSVLERLSGTSQQVNPDQANATIGNIDFDFVDKGSIITSTLGAQLALGRSTRQQRVRVYMGYAGDAWADYTLIQTQLVSELSYSAGMYTVHCQDIQRAMRNNIFTQAVSPLAASVAASALTVASLAGAGTLTLASTVDFPASGSGTIRDASIPASDNDAFAWTGKTPTTLTGCTGLLVHSVGAIVCDATINVVDTTKFTMVAHGTSYTDAPSATVGYLIIDKEVVRYTGITPTTFTGCTRGALNTVAAAHPIDLTTAGVRTPVTEYVYLELPAIDLMYRLLTGKDRTGATVLPTSWNLGISTAYVRLTDFTGIGKDLWDLTDDLQGFVVRFEDLRQLDGKKFIETELALLCGVFMPVYADGALGCKRMANILAGAAYVAQLDESNSVSVSALTHDMISLHNIIQVSWNWEPSLQQFTRIDIFIDQPSITVHQQGITLKLAFRGLHGSIHSQQILKGRFDALRDRYTGPPLRMTAQLLHRYNVLEVGDVVRCKYRTVRDFVANSTLDRSFEVQGINIDWVTGALGLKLFASSRAPGPITGNATTLTTAWYASQGTLLATGVGGITITGSNPGHVTVGGTLAGNADANNAAAIYYYPGDLQIDQGVNINITQNVQLRIQGNLQVNGSITGKGAGLAAGVVGTAGFIGSTESGGGLEVQPPVFGTVFSTRGTLVVGANSTVPAFNLKWNGTLLTGLPTDLRGSSGSRGGQVTGRTAFTSPPVALGGLGGDGGAGLIVVCRGLALGAAGRVDLSGNDGANGATANDQGYIFYAGSGAGGAPGGLLVLLDGPAAATGLTELGFLAVYGKTPIRPGHRA
jgi:hypothetical protein